MTKYIKLLKKSYPFIIVFSIILNIGITSTVQRFKCVKLSETQLFMEIPNNFIYRFKKCNG